MGWWGAPGSSGQRGGVGQGLWPWDEASAAAVEQAALDTPTPRDLDLSSELRRRSKLPWTAWLTQQMGLEPKTEVPAGPTSGEGPPPGSSLTGRRGQAAPWGPCLEDGHWSHREGPTLTTCSPPRLNTLGVRFPNASFLGGTDTHFLQGLVAWWGMLEKLALKGQAGGWVGWLEGMCSPGSRQPPLENLSLGDLWAQLSLVVVAAAVAVAVSSKCPGTCRSAPSCLWRAGCSQSRWRCGELMQPHLGGGLVELPLSHQPPAFPGTGSVCGFPQRVPLYRVPVACRVASPIMSHTRTHTHSAVLPALSHPALQLPGLTPHKWSAPGPSQAVCRGSELARQRGRPAPVQAGAQEEGEGPGPLWPTCCFVTSAETGTQ